MRKLFGLITAGLLTFGAAEQANAIVMFVNGSLALQIATLSPAVLPSQGTAAVLVNGSGGPGHLTAIGFTNNVGGIPGSLFITAGFVLPVTDPGAAPIGGVQVTAGNATGNFQGMSGGGGGGGVMPLVGAAKVCLFGPCSAAVQNLTVPLGNVGLGGASFVNAAVKITVIGAPWTTGTAAVATITVMGGAHGPASGTSSTAAPSGTVTLVTPVFVSTNISASAVVPTFGFLNLHFVPEPGTLLLVGTGIAGLVLFGRSRRS